MSHILIDLSNLIHKCKYVVRGDPETKGAMALHIIFNSILSSWNRFDGSLLVVCADSTSWRNEHYKKYKAARRVKSNLRTPREVEEDTIYFDMMNKLGDFLRDKTNCVFLKKDRLEADDLISVWIKNNPDKNHVIVSGDGDFYQLLDKNVRIYDSIKKIVVYHDKVLNEKGENLEFIIDTNAKLKLKEVNKNFVPASDWYKWCFFVKLIRGDSSDGIVSCHSGARLKGTKDKPGILEAYSDRHTQGWAWTNFMLQPTISLNNDDEIVAVKDLFKLNTLLMDLNNTPETILIFANEYIEEQMKQETKKNIGIEFLRFCAKHRLDNLAKYSDKYINVLNSRMK
jgi:hypothetical protein